MGFQLGEDHDSGMNEMNLIPPDRHYVGVDDYLLVTATVANPSIPLSLPKQRRQFRPTTKKRSPSLTREKR